MSPQGRHSAAVVDGVGRLARLMRLRGARVGLDDVLRAHRALAAVDPAAPRQARFALRAALCARHADLALFDAAFDEAFGRVDEVPEALREAGRTVLPRAPASAPPRVGAAPREGDAEVVPSAASAAELLRDRDFAAMDDAERRDARRLLAALAARGAQRRSRRTRLVGGRGERLDHRATLRAALRTGGEPLTARWRSATLRPRPLVLVVDVSGSMEPYARMLLAYAHACVGARGRVEVFAFGTRLTRLTRKLDHRDPDVALGRAAAALPDLHGGTRIGAAIAALNREHGRRVGRGADVVVLSDGWDRGEPGQLAAELARLSRCAHRLVWLNPLKARPGYEPLTRGMVAAMPFVDRLLAGNTLRSLGDVAAALEAV